MSSDKKKPLTPREREICQRLKAIWDLKHDELGLTQDAVAGVLEISQGGVGHYLNGRNAIGFEAMFWWAQLLQVHPYEIDPNFAEQLPDDLRLAVDNMMVGGSHTAREAYRAIAKSALALHEATPNHYGSKSSKAS